jgi:uncharacterized protein involved in exopolysaccharide biosynthesis
MIHHGTNVIELHHIATLMRRRWKLISAFALSSVALAIVVGVFMPVEYNAKAQLLVNSSGFGGGDTVDDAAVDTHIELILSPSHLRLTQESLANNQGAIPSAGAASQFNPITGSADGSPVQPPQNRPSVPELSLTASAQAAASQGDVAATYSPIFIEFDDLEKNLTAYKERSSRVIAVSFTWTDPKIAAFVANRVADLYVQQGRERALARREIAIRQLDERIPLARAELDRAEASVRDHRRSHGHAVSSRASDIQGRLISLEQSRDELRDAELKLRELERTSTAAALVYEEILRRKSELSALDGVQEGAEIISIASVPDEPSSPSPILFVLPALVIAGFAGGFSAVLLERLDRRLRSEQDVEETLGIPCIGLVPTMAEPQTLSAQRRLIDESLEPYTEAIRSVAAAALTKVPHDPMVFLVTSSVQGEGKTTLAISFSVYAALLGRNVLLIDLNVRNPEILARLGGSDENEVLDVFGERGPQAAIKKEPELGIDYLPLSSNRKYPLEILSTDHLPKMLDDLGARYDCIVIDTSPLLGSTEVRHLASLADRVIFTVKWGSTELETARAAMHQLRFAGMGNLAEHVSAVVTQVDMEKHIYCRYGEIGELPHAMEPVEA